MPAFLRHLLRHCSLLWLLVALLPWPQALAVAGAVQAQRHLHLPALTDEAHLHLHAHAQAHDGHGHHHDHALAEAGVLRVGDADDEGTGGALEAGGAALSPSAWRVPGRERERFAAGAAAGWHSHAAAPLLRPPRATAA